MKNVFAIILLFWGISSYASEIPRYEVVEPLSDDIKLIEIQKDTVWLVTDFGLEKRLKNGKILKKIKLDNAYSIAIDKTGIVWVGSSSGLYQIKSDSLVDVRSRNAIFRSSINNIKVDENGKIWVLTQKGAVSIYNDVITTFNESTGFIDVSIIDVVEKNSSVYFTEYYGSVFKYSNSKYDTLIGNDEFYSKSIHFLNNDSILIKAGYGMYIYSNNKATSLGDTTASFVLKIADSVLFITDNDCVVSYKKGVFTNITKCPATIKAATIDGDTIWASTYEGVFCYQNNVWKRLPFLSSYQMSVVATDKNDNVWFVQSSTVVKRSVSGDLKIYDLPNIGDNTVTNIAISSKNQVCISTNGNGIYKFINNEFVNFTDGLPSTSVYDILFDKNDSLWIATFEGVAQLNGTKWKAYTTTDGLVHDVNQSLSLDTAGSIYSVSYNYDTFLRGWVYNGISIFKNNVWKKYIKTDTVSILNINFDNNNNIWLSTTNGVLFYDKSWHSFNSVLDSNRNYQVIQDKVHHTWIGNSRGLYFFFNNNITNIIKGRKVGDIAFDSKNNVWAVVEGWGLVRFNKPTSNFTHTDACKGKKVTLTAQSSSATDTYYWDINRDGIPDLTGKTIEYQVSAVKDKIVDSVTLLVKNGFDSTAITKVIKIHKPAIPQIGVVTVSDNGKSLLIAWERKKDLRIAGYKVYRQFLTNFDSIAYVPFESVGIYRDDNSNYVRQAYTYKLTAIDDCGVESPLDSSIAHTSIHVSLSPSAKKENCEMRWDPYKGMKIKGYNIYETKDGSVDKPIGTLENDKTSFTIENAKVGYFYRLGAILMQEVDPSEVKSDTGPFSQSLSSMSEASLVSIDELKDVAVFAYPQVTSDVVTLVASSTEDLEVSYSIVSHDGHVIANSQIPKSTVVEAVIPVSDLAKGTYELRATINGSPKVFRFIKQ